MCESCVSDHDDVASERNSERKEKGKKINEDVTEKVPDCDIPLDLSGV